MRELINESEEVEEVDDENPVPPPEEISDTEEVNSGNENEVSIKKKDSNKNSQVY